MSIAGYCRALFFPDYKRWFWCACTYLQKHVVFHLKIPNALTTTIDCVFIDWFSTFRKFSSSRLLAECLAHVYQILHILGKMANLQSGHWWSCWMPQLIALLWKNEILKFVAFWNFQRYRRWRTSFGALWNFHRVKADPANTWSRRKLSCIILRQS